MEENRKKKIVNRRLQYQMIGLMASSGLFISLLTVIFLRIFSNQVFEIIESSNLDNRLVFSLIDVMSRMSTYFAIFVVISLLLTWFIALYFSNRIAGPIYNINRVLDDYLAGEKDLQIKTRDKDYFPDLVEKLNRILKEKP